MVPLPNGFQQVPVLLSLAPGWTTGSSPLPSGRGCRTAVLTSASALMSLPASTWRGGPRNDATRPPCLRTGVHYLLGPNNERGGDDWGNARTSVSSVSGWPRKPGKVAALSECRPCSTGQPWVEPGGDEMGTAAAKSLSQSSAFREKVRWNKDLRPSSRRGTGQQCARPDCRAAPGNPSRRHAQSIETGIDLGHRGRPGGDDGRGCAVSQSIDPQALNSRPAPRPGPRGYSAACPRSLGRVRAAARSCASSALLRSNSRIACSLPAR